MSSPSDDWTEFYQTNLSAGIDEVDPFVRASSSNMFPTGNHVSSVAEATVVTTTIVSPTINSSTSHQLLNNPAAGRVSKPTTRRRRASRCAPVTLLNTDTNNFRAMVQQFTGVTNAPFSIGDAQTNYNLPNLNFGLSSSSNIGRYQNPTVTTPLRPTYQYHQQQQQQQQQHQQQQQQQQQQQLQQFQVSSLNNNGVNPLEQISNNGFFMENNSSGNENRGGHDGGNGYILR